MAAGEEFKIESEDVESNLKDLCLHVNNIESSDTNNPKLKYASTCGYFSNISGSIFTPGSQEFFACFNNSLSDYNQDSWADVPVGKRLNFVKNNSYNFADISSCKLFTTDNKLSQLLSSRPESDLLSELNWDWVPGQIDHKLLRCCGQGGSGGKGYFDFQPTQSVGGGGGGSASYISLSINYQKMFDRINNKKVKIGSEYIQKECIGIRLNIKTGLNTSSIYGGEQPCTTMIFKGIFTESGIYIYKEIFSFIIFDGWDGENGQKNNKPAAGGSGGNIPMCAINYNEDFLLSDILDTDYMNNFISFSNVSDEGKIALLRFFGISVLDYAEGQNGGNGGAYYSDTDYNKSTSGYSLAHSEVFGCFFNTLNISNPLSSKNINKGYGILPQGDSGFLPEIIYRNLQLGNYIGNRNIDIGFGSTLFSPSIILGGSGNSSNRSFVAYGGGGAASIFGHGGGYIKNIEEDTEWENKEWYACPGAGGCGSLCYNPNDDPTSTTEKQLYKKTDYLVGYGRAVRGGPCLVIQYS